MYGPCRSPITMFEDVVPCYPEKVALINHTGIPEYAGLNVRANQLAHELKSCGVGLESVVGLALPKGIDHIVAMLACWKIGAACLPLDQSLPIARMQYMVSDSGCAHLITIEWILQEKSLSLEVLLSLCLDDRNIIQRIRTHPKQNISNVIPGDHLAYIIYTSGTTGNPKGVPITHPSLSNLIEDIRLSGEIASTDRVLLFSPLCFDASIRDICGTLMVGASLYIPDEEETLPGNLMETIARYRITNSVITPSVLRACVFRPLPHLRTIVIAGETADEHLIRTWGAGRRLINAYGPTEATVCSTKRVYHNGITSKGGSASVIGNPILNTTVIILDDHDAPLQHGQIGEICILGPGVSSRGYLNMPPLSSERFKDIRACSYRMYRTGDLGKLTPNGEVQCLGRKGGTRQVKLNGQRIELEEIENVIRKVPWVSDTAVTIEGSGSSRRICAYVVPTEHKSGVVKDALTSQLSILLRQNLPSYSQPSIIELFDALPLTVSRKLDINALSARKSKENTALEPTTCITSLEKKIANSLLKALALPTNLAVSPKTTYGELGGNSLQAATVLRYLNASLNCKISFSHFYRTNISVSQIAELISNDTKLQRSLYSDDFTKRTQIAHDIAYSVHAQSLRKERHVLLTGATGFLGSHILVELLRDRTTSVHCIVRAANETCARARIEAALRKWGLWEHAQYGNFKVYCGDVSKPFLGLAADEYLHLATRTDTVYHSAAAVSFIASFGELEAANVTATLEILRFASAITQKRLTYVSTLSVFFGAGSKTVRGMEAPVHDLHSNILTGYGQSKWVSEQLVLDWANHGGHALILRPGRLLGSIKNLKCPEDDFTVRLMASMLELKAAPRLDEIGGDDWQIDLTPVDCCARSIHHLSVSNFTGIRHLFNKKTVTFKTIRRSLGPHIQRLPYREWLQVVPASKYLAPLSSIFTDPVSQLDSRSTFEALINTPMFRNSDYEAMDEGFWSISSAQLLHKYLATNEMFCLKKVSG